MHRRTRRQSNWDAVLWVGAALTPALCLSQNPSSSLNKADSAFRAGQAAMVRGDLAAAQANFEQVVRLAPALESGHSALGAVLLDRGDAPQAIREFEAALALNRQDESAQTNLALAYQRAAQPAKAVTLYQSLEHSARLRHRALSGQVLGDFAKALAATGDLREATAKMKAARLADPKNVNLCNDLGSLYAQQRDWQAAQQQFAEAVRLAPDLASTHLRLGLAMQAQGEAGATSELERAAQLAPQDNGIALELGKAYAANGQDDRAIAQFRQVLERQPGQPAAALELALALQRQGAVKEATTLLQEVVAAEPDNATALINLGLALSQSLDAKDAVPLLQRGAALAPDNVAAHEDLASAYVQLNQLDDAVKELHAALALNPALPQLHYNLGVAYKMQDRPAEAIPELEAAERLDAANSEAPYALGLLYMQAGRYPDAARELKKSLDLHAQNGDGWATLGSVYSRLDMLPEATAALREATRQLPDQPEPHLTLAGVLTKQNLTAEAVAERKKAAELMRTNMNHQRAEVATNSGNGMLKNGDLAAAAERFRDALTYDPNYRDAHLGLAQVLDAQGKPAEASAERKLAAPLQEATGR